MPVSAVVKPVYDLTHHKGIMVIGFDYCRHTMRAVKLLTEYGVSFRYFEATNNRHCYYTNLLAAQLAGQYKWETDSDFTKRAGPHSTAPIIMENTELIGGADQIQALLLKNPEEVAAIRKRACAATTPIVMASGASSSTEPFSGSVDTAVVQKILALWKGPTSTFQFIGCKEAIDAQ
jgi:glutaredoxin